MIKVEEFLSVPGGDSFRIVSKYLKSFEKYVFPFVLFSVVFLFSACGIKDAMFSAVMLYPLLVLKSAYYSRIHSYRGWFFVINDLICILSSYWISIKFFCYPEPFYIFSMLVAFVCIPFYLISCFDSKQEETEESFTTIWDILEKYNPLTGSNLFSFCGETNLEKLGIELKVKDPNRKKGVSVTLILTDRRLRKQHSINFPPMEAELIVKTALATKMDEGNAFRNKAYGKVIKNKVLQFSNEKNSPQSIRNIERIRKRLKKEIYDGFGNKSYEPFSDARDFVRKLQFKSVHEWYKYCFDEIIKKDERPDTIPVHPNQVYKDFGWKSWNDSS